MKIIQVDVAIIGHGTAGANAFRAAREHTDNVVIIEGGEYGTTCARVGCMPSKLLISAADAVHEIQAAKVFGVSAENINIDGKKVMQRVREMRDFFVSFVIQAVENIAQEKRIRGYARFTDNHTLQVDDHTLIQAQSIVIATGSSPFIPPILEPVKDQVQNSDDVFYWQDLPKSLAIFGTGIIGLELGQALHRLGVKVTIFGRSGRVGILTHPELQEYCANTFAEEYDLVKKPEIHNISPFVKGKSKGVCIKFTDEHGNKRNEEYDSILGATGRRLNLDKLGLENTNLKLNAKGVPEFDKETLQCGESSIFIAGDVNGERQLLHEAADEGKSAGSNAAQFPKLQILKRRIPTTVVFTDPQIAIAGKSFRELTKPPLKRGVGGFVIGRLNYEKQGRAQVMAKNKGQMHLYADPKTGELLGAEIFGPRAEHMAHLLSWSIAQKLTCAQMLTMPFYHPTLEEGLRTALQDVVSYNILNEK